MILEIDKRHIVQSFHEDMLKLLAIALIEPYVPANRSLLDHLNSMATHPKDFSTEVVPRQMCRIQK